MKRLEIVAIIKLEDDLPMVLDAEIGGNSTLNRGRKCLKESEPET